MISNILFNRSDIPYGIFWEKWASLWYNWMFSIPKKVSPCRDVTGRYSSVKQKDKNVWFLAGTFGNMTLVRRKCVIPRQKSIFFPVLVKEDSFAEDIDLRRESELRKRSKEATDNVLNMEVTIKNADHEQELSLRTRQLLKYRVRTQVFDLVFPRNNVYDVKAGRTRSVCDGYWIFTKPLGIGNYSIFFKGETLLANEITKNRMKKTEVYSACNEIIEKNLFRVEVLYEIAVEAGME